MAIHHERLQSEAGVLQLRAGKFLVNMSSVNFPNSSRPEVSIIQPMSWDLMWNTFIWPTLTAMQGREQVLWRREQEATWRSKQVEPLWSCISFSAASTLANRKLLQLQSLQPRPLLASFPQHVAMQLFSMPTRNKPCLPCYQHPAPSSHLNQSPRLQLSQQGTVCKASPLLVTQPSAGTGSQSEQRL